MKNRTFLLVVFDRTEAEWLIDKAADTASGFDAHLTVLHPFTPVIFPGGFEAEPMIFSTILDWEETESAAIRSKVEDVLRRNGLRGEYRAQTGLYGAEAFLLAGARAADTVVIGATGDRSPDDRILAHRLIREAGRPVLVLGRNAALAGPAQRIVMGWTETREAARAVHDATGMATPGAEITLLSLHGRASEVSTGLSAREDLATAFDRAGFRVTVTERPANADDRAAELLRCAREMGADLLVTGAFGHSQVYDMLVGAVTPELLNEAPVPTLLSH